MKIKAILSELKSYAMLGIILLGGIILFTGLGAYGSSYNIHFIIIGALILLAFVSYFIIDKIKTSRYDKRKKQDLIEFKNKADKIRVKLDDLEIKSNSWHETVIVDNTQYAGLNELAGRGARNIRSVKKNLNHVKIKIPYRSKKIEYNFSIPMDTNRLKLHFAVKKETFLYIDPKNENKMYLDLEFLE